MLNSGNREFVLEVASLEHHVIDKRRNEEFVVYVDQPLQIPMRSTVAILGPSGCGKTTLLTVLGLLRKPSHVEKLTTFKIMTVSDGNNKQVIDLKQAWSTRNYRLIEQIRRERIGFALQSGELLPALTVRENIAIPLRLNGLTASNIIHRTDELLSAFQLTRPGRDIRIPLAQSRINTLSGGEYQRVSLARAIAHRPTLLFVDEPTAALNRELAWEALEQLKKVNSDATHFGATIMITHDEEIAGAFANVIIRMMPIRGRPAGIVTEVNIHHHNTEQFCLPVEDHVPQ